MDRKTYYVVISFFVISALILSYVYFPSSEDVAWMYFYAKQYNRSSETFYQHFSQEERSRHSLVPKVMLEVEYAKVDEAIDTVEKYVEENPADLDARIYLGSLYQKASRPYAYLRNLEAIYRQAPNVEILKELKNAYKDLNKSQGQLTSLQELVDRKAAEIEDFRTLSQLYASTGQMSLALETLNQMLSRFPVKRLDRQTMNLTINLLMDNGKDNQAFLLASKFSTSHPEDVESMLNFSYKMLEAGRVQEAKFLADLIPQSRQNETKVLELMMSILLENQNEQEVFEMLADEFERGSLLPSFYSQLFILALTYKDSWMTRKMLEQLDFTRVPQARLVRLIDHLISFRKPELARRLKDNLGEEFIQQSPVIDLGIQIAELGGIEKIKEIDLQEKFTSQERLQLAQFFYSSGYGGAALKLMKTVDTLEGIQVEDMDSFVELYISLGLVEEIDQMLKDYTLKPGYPSDPFIRSKLFVLAAKGEADELEKWLNLQEKVSQKLLQELYSVAEKTKQKNTALKLAERLNRISRNPYSEMIMARALALNERPKEALKIIRRLKREGVDVRDNYFYTLVLAANQNELYSMELEDFIDSVLRDSTIRESKKREYGYNLIENKLRGMARPIFEALAEGKNFRSGDVQTLLDLWGDQLTNSRISWIEQQAENAEGEELAGWIAHLVYNKQPAAGASLAERVGWRHPKVAEIYLEALEGAKDREGIKEALAVLIERETNVKRLGKMGKMSFDLGLYPASETAYKKILDEDPGQPESLKQLGMIKFSLGNYHGARFYLQRYLKTDEPDYLGYYYYGEIYWIYKHWRCARRHFHIALHLLTDEDNLNPFSELIEAELYYRMGCVTKAFCLFEKIIDKYPEKSSVRVDYANVLLVLEKYCRAAYLLATADPEKNQELDPEQLKNEIINLELSKVQLTKQLNRLRAAWRMTAKLLKIYPDEPRIMVMQADLEKELGRWWRAVEWLEAAIQIEPQNEGWKKIQRDIFCEQAKYFFMQREYKLTGTTQREIIDELLVFHRIDKEYIFKFRAGSDQLSLPDAFDPFDGTVEPFQGTRYRGEIAIQRQYLNGFVIELQGFLAREGPGCGLETLKPDLYGTSRMQLWYHRQTWEFTQSIIDFGLEDRVEFFRSLNIGPRTELFGKGGYRWYYLNRFGLVAETYVFTTGVNYRLPKRNLLSRQFGDGSSVFFNFYVDAQYPTKEKKVFSPILDQVVLPLDIEKRETWVWQLSFNKVFCPSFRVEGYAGANWDRATLGDVGPIGGILAYIGTECGPQLRFQYVRTFSSQFENQSVDRFIADFKIHY